jgi:aromatic-L-amino-acid decarboxylase
MTKTTGKVNDYRDWGIQLGRRFRALKLWFVIRSFGVDGLKDKIRFHIELAKKLEQFVLSNPEFELMAPRTLNLVCFRYWPSAIIDTDELNKINEILLNKLNSSGHMFLTHTKLNGRYALRIVIGQTNVEEVHLDNAISFIIKTAGGISETNH